jgi:phage/plasmid-like protein (TIGR03299 family)
LTEAPSFDEALRLAQLDYAVEKRPTFRLVGDTEFVQNDRAFITYRPDTAKELGVVGADYGVLANYDAFRALIPLLDAGVCRLETGGVLRDGADAWLQARFDVERFGPVVREVFADEVIPFALFTNNHAGRRNATVAETPVRVVCANTLAMAEHDMTGSGKFIGVRHTASAAERMVEAAETLFQAIVERFEVIAQQYKLLKAVHLSDTEFRRLIIAPAFDDPSKRAGWNPEAKLAESVVARYEEKVAEVTRLWTEGQGHKGDHSAWEAYNGLVEAIDHNTKLFPTRGGCWRTASLMDGSLRRRKQLALTAVVKFAQASEH